MAPILCQSIAGARFSKASYSTSIPKVDRKLLYPFNKDKTLLALDSIQEQANSLYDQDLKGLVVLDKLSQTISSDTHRVYDKCEKKFFAVKTLNMDSENSWKQLNLIFRNQQENYSSLQKFSFLNYDHAGKEAKIISEIQKNVLLNDVLTPRTWKTDELKTLTVQLLKQADSLKQLGAYCNYIKPEHIFADQVNNTLKLFDFSGFEIESQNSFWGQPTLSLDAITFSLVKIIDPLAPVNHPEEAQIYIKRKYPEFYQDLKVLKSKAGSLWFNMQHFESSFHDIKQAASKNTFFHSAEYDQLNLNRLKQTIQSENLPNFNEVWGSVNQGFEKYNDAANAFKKSLDQNIEQHGYAHENTCRSYLDLAESFQAMERPGLAMDYYKKAINVSFNYPSMDGLLMARLYNGYGTLLKAEKQFKDALDCFKKADKALKDSGISHPSFAAKIEADLNSVPHHSTESYESIYKDFVGAWTESFCNYKKSWHDMHGKNHTERYAAKMKDFAENMENFGKKMEQLGERYKNHNWNAEYSRYKWQSHDYFNKQYESWHQKWTEKMKNVHNHHHHHHNKGFMNWRWHHHHHHNKGHHHWAHHHYGSWNKPHGCGFFSRTRRFIRFMFKFTFYSILFIFFIKLWKKAMKPPKDRPEEGSFQMNGPALETLQQEEKKEKKHWSFWNRCHDHHHRNEGQENGEQMNRESWWSHRHHRHHRNEDQQNGEQNDKKGWWSHWHDRYHKKNEDQQNDSAAPVQEPERRRRHRYHRQASQEASQPVVAAAPAVTQEQGTQTEVPVQREPVENMRGFHSRRHGHNCNRKEFEETMKKYEDWKAIHQHQQDQEEDMKPDVVEVIRETPEQKRVLAQVAPKVEEKVRIVEPRQVTREEKKERPSANIQVNKQPILSQTSASPVKKSEDIKIVNVVAELNKDLPPQENSKNWLLFGFYALISTIGLSL